MQSVSSHPARRWTLLALVALLGLALTFTASSASSAGSGQAVAAKKKCKKKHKSAAEAKKKKCKKKKKKVTTVPPVTTPSGPTTPPPEPELTLRASLSFNSDAYDLDLYVWDASGNLAFWDDQEGIPEAFTTSNDPSPEEFFDLQSPSTREFTYGVCVYQDGDTDEGTDTEVDYELDAPGDSPPFTDVDTLTGTGDFALYLGPFDPGTDWCQTYLDTVP